MVPIPLGGRLFNGCYASYTSSVNIVDTFPKGKALYRCATSRGRRGASTLLQGGNATAVATPHPPSSMVRPSPQGEGIFFGRTSLNETIALFLMKFANANIVRPYDITPHPLPCKEKRSFSLRWNALAHYFSLHHSPRGRQRCRFATSRGRHI